MRVGQMRGKLALHAVGLGIGSRGQGEAAFRGLKAERGLFSPTPETGLAPVGRCELW